MTMGQAIIETLLIILPALVLIALNSRNDSQEENGCSPLISLRALLLRGVHLERQRCR
jgi:hypothetical protein